jgi:hypothetical protein
MGGKSGMGRRISLNVVGAMLGVLVWAGGCDEGQCSCPAPSSAADVHLGCPPIEPPVVKTTGPCSVFCPPGALANGWLPDGGSSCADADSPQDITLTGNGAGTCHVELTFANGATSSVDVDFMFELIACGSDPKGCGQHFVAPTATVSVPEAACNAGPDAGASD